MGNKLESAVRAAIDSSPDLMAMISQLVDLEEEEWKRKWTSALLSGFETVPADPRFCVRRSEVVDHVVRALGIEVLNNRVFADVERAARSIGWQPVKNGGRSLFRCVKRKGQDDAEALVVSRAHRRDPRWPRHIA